MASMGKSAGFVWLLLFSLLHCAVAFSSTRSWSRIRSLSYSPVTKYSIHPFDRKVAVQSLVKERSVDLSVSTKEEEEVPSTMTEAINRFFFGPDRGPMMIAMIISTMASWRMRIGPLTTMDMVAFGGTVVFWWFQEHFLHDKLLHSDQNWMGKEIHKTHHDRPYYHISIDPAPLMLGWLTVACLCLFVLLPDPLSISASIGYASAGIFYEWTHYIVHTRVKPPNAFWKRVKDHHRRHHCVNQNYWFGFSVPAIDTFFGTNPSVSESRSKF